MKKTLAARLVIGALATIAAGSVFAGVLGSTSIQIAREAVATDAHKITSPLISYRFQGAINATAEPQTFQMQYVLTEGEWDAVPDNDRFQISDKNGAAQPQTALDPTAPAQMSYQVLASGLSTDKKTLWATFRVNQHALANVQEPVVSVNVKNNALGTDTTQAPLPAASVPLRVTKIFNSVVKSIVQEYQANPGSGVENCSSVKRMKLKVRHYTAPMDPLAMVDGTTNPGTAGPGVDEHERVGSLNESDFVIFPTNIKIDVTPLAAARRNAVIKPGGNAEFTLPDGTQVQGGIPERGNMYIDSNVVLLGSFNLRQLSSQGLDANLKDYYLLKGNAAHLGVEQQGPDANNIDGLLEVEKTIVTVTGSAGFGDGGKIRISNDPQCQLGAVNVVGTAMLVEKIAPNASTKQLTLEFANSQVAYDDDTTDGNATNTGTGNVYVCYVAPGGGKQIPNSSFKAVVELSKAPDAANIHNEQNNICEGPLIGFGGGLKIDVRNYASSKEAANSKYKSVIRLINNSDIREADVFAQIIHQDGKLGNWGKIADLPVRGIKNMTADEIEALLTNAPQVPNEAKGPGEVQTSALGAPRLRITSESGGSLRVQNYLWNMETNQIYEASGSQAVDFEGNNLRAPGNDGQYISQDAESGLNLAK